MCFAHSPIWVVKVRQLASESLFRRSRRVNPKRVQLDLGLNLWLAIPSLNTQEIFLANLRLAKNSKPPVSKFPFYISTSKAKLVNVCNSFSNEDLA